MLTGTERAQALAEIERDETQRGTRRAVAGFDYTFSVPKSVSVLWGVTDRARRILDRPAAGTMPDGRGRLPGRLADHQSQSAGGFVDIEQRQDAARIAALLSRSPASSMPSPGTATPLKWVVIHPFGKSALEPRG